MTSGKAEIICTGSELLEGRLNLYVPLFHDRLAPLGFRITREQSSGDDLDAIADCIRGGLRRADLVITCGGLGPTFDDLTRQAAAKALGRGTFHSKPCERILAFNYKLEKLPPNIKDQAMLVEGAKALENANGTAFGEVLVRGRKMLVLLPGPLKEWEPMFRSLLDREIRSFFGLTPLAQVKLRAAGLGEPQAERLLRPAMRRFQGARYTILAGPGLIDFIVSGDDRQGIVTRAAAHCRRLLGEHLYGEGDAALAAVLGEKLKARGATAAAAESCTGGLASQMITEVPGSSAYFLGAAVTYSNAAKASQLGVKAATLRRHGAVSEECAREMASGARKAFGADYAFSITGIAGPDGGTDDKPVGLVYFGLARKGGVSVFRKQFRHGRSFIRSCAANFILDELRKIIK